MSGIIIFTSIAFIMGIALAITNYFLNKEEEKPKEDPTNNS